MKKTNLIFTSAMVVLLLSACATTPDVETIDKHTVHEKSAPKAVIQIQKSPEELRKTML